MQSVLLLNAYTTHPYKMFSWLVWFYLLYCLYYLYETNAFHQSFWSMLCQLTSYNVMRGSSKQSGQRLPVSQLYLPLTFFSLQEGASSWACLPSPKTPARTHRNFALRGCWSHWWWTCCLMASWPWSWLSWGWGRGNRWPWMPSSPPLPGPW